MEDFEKHKGLVYKVFNEKFQYARYIEDDLIQEGLWALWHACQNFDSTKGAAFPTFATKCVTNAMGMYMRKENKHSSRCASLSQVINPEKGPATYEDMLEEQAVDIKDSAQWEQVMDIIKDEPQYIMIQMKMDGLSQADIAKKLGITQCSVSEQLRGLYARVRKALGIEEQKKKNF